MNTLSERAQRQADRHFKELEALGVKDGKRAYNQLRKIENFAHHWTLKISERYFDPDFLAKIWEGVEERVRKVFGGTLPNGFFINKDPRGLALKIEQPEYPNRVISLTDWGGYGLIAPEWED